MKRQLLLKVDDSFLISGRGLIVTPHLEPIPAGFKAFAESLVVRRPDSSEIELAGNFTLTHFTTQTGGNWMIAVSLPANCKDLVPIGSELWVSESAFNKLKPVIG